MFPDTPQGTTQSQGELEIFTDTAGDVYMMINGELVKGIRNGDGSGILFKGKNNKTNGVYDVIIVGDCNQPAVLRRRK